jgi:membrane protease YdiL (CAAX protease family)
MTDPLDAPPPTASAETPVEPAPTRKRHLPRPREALTVVGQTFLLMIVEFALIGALAAVGVQAGNSGGEEILEMSKKGALHLLVVGAVVGPLIEELVFRGAPSLVSDWITHKRDAPRWGLGLVTTLLFGALHNFTTAATEHSLQLAPDLHFDLQSIPIPQILVGFYCWHLMRTRGFWANALAHMFHNGLLLSIGFAAMEHPTP